MTRRVLVMVGRPVALYTAVAAVVSAVHVAGWRWLDVPALPVSLLAATLGILLGFRNNSGYARWWEARTLWGGVVNQSRTFARQVLTFLPAVCESAASVVVPAAESRSAEGLAEGFDGAVRDLDGTARVVERHLVDLRAAASPGAVTVRSPAPDERRDERGSDGRTAVTAEARELVYAQIAFVHAMRCHLRREDPVDAITPYLAPAVLGALRGEQNVPAAILAWTAMRLRHVLDGRRGDDAFRLVALDRTLTELTNLLGGCERIKNTPIPRPYDWLPNVMVRLYLLILPLGMVAELGLVTPLVTAVIALLFLALDAIGRAVETPFENAPNDTPMTALCRTIEINLRQMLGERDLPPPVQPVGGILL